METTHYCPNRAEMVTLDQCTEIIVNPGDGDRLDVCQGCEHGKARMGTSPLKRVEKMPPAPPRVAVEPTPVGGYEAAEQKRALKAVERRAYESNVETAWDRVHQATALSQGKIAKAIGRAQCGVSAMFRVLARGDEYRGALLDEVCAKFRLDKGYILTGVPSVVAPVQEDSEPAATPEPETAIAPTPEPEEAEPSVEPGLALEQLIMALRAKLPGVTITLTL